MPPIIFIYLLCRIVQTVSSRWALLTPANHLPLILKRLQSRTAIGVTFAKPNSSHGKFLKLWPWEFHGPMEISRCASLNQAKNSVYGNGPPMIILADSISVLKKINKMEMKKQILKFCIRSGFSFSFHLPLP